MLVGLAAVAVVAAAWFLAAASSVNAQVQVFWVLQPPLDVLMLVLSVQVARLPGLTSATRRFWRAFAFAGAVFAVGDLAQVAIAFVRPGAAAADPGSVQGLTVVVGASGIIWAMLTYPTGLHLRAERIRFWLDAMSVMVAAAVYVWFFSYGHVARDNLILLGSGVLLVAVFAVVKLLLSGSAPITRDAGLTAVASAAAQWAMTAVGPTLDREGEVRLQLAAHMVPAVLVVAVPRVQLLRIATDPGRLTARRSRSYSRLPYVAIAATQGLVVAAALGQSVTPRLVGVLIGSAALLAIVVMRQLFAFADNARLLGKLDATLLELRQQEHWFRSLVQHASDLTLVLASDAAVRYATPASEQVLGLSPEGITGTSALAWVHEDDLPIMRETLALSAAAPRASFSCQVRFRHADGSWRWLAVTATNLLDEPSVQGIVCNMHDVTKAARLQERLRYLATHDPLTKLPNRMLFDEELSSLRARPALGRLAILVADLDQFKVINDTLGHHVGDRVLMIAADRLRKAVRPGDTVARLGGDEFAILLPGATRADADGIAERIAKEFAEPFVVEGKALRVRASIGLAGGALEDAETLLRDADASMYAAKHSDAGAHLDLG